MLGDEAHHDLRDAQAQQARKRADPRLQQAKQPRALRPLDLPRQINLEGKSDDQGVHDSQTRNHPDWLATFLAMLIDIIL